MFAKLLPRETCFFDFFEQHVALIIEGAQEFFLLTSPAANIQEKAKRIQDIEHETDVITHRCIEALHKTFITPIERDDIHRLISRMDDIIDFIDAAAERVVLYDVQAMMPEVKNLAEVLVRASKEVAEAINGLRDKKNFPAVLKCCIDVNRLENEGDAILRVALARLFKEEGDAIAIIKWMEIYENLENATDRCEDVANIIEGLILESA